MNFQMVRMIISFVEHDPKALFGFITSSNNIMDLAIYSLNYKWTQKYYKYFNEETKAIEKRFAFFWHSYLGYITNIEITKQDEKKLKKIGINKLIMNKLNYRLDNEIALDLMIFDNYKKKNCWKLFELMFKNNMKGRFDFLKYCIYTDPNKIYLIPNDIFNNEMAKYVFDNYIDRIMEEKEEYDFFYNMFVKKRYPDAMLNYQPFIQYLFNNFIKQEDFIPQVYNNNDIIIDCYSGTEWFTYKIKDYDLQRKPIISLAMYHAFIQYKGKFPEILCYNVNNELYKKLQQNVSNKTNIDTICEIANKKYNLKWIPNYDKLYPIGLKLFA